MRNLVSGKRFEVYAEAQRARTRKGRAGFYPVSFGQAAAIDIRTEADTVQASAAAEDIASALPFSSLEQAFLTAGAASLARMILHWPARGELVIAIVEKAGVRGMAIVARFRGETGSESTRRGPVCTPRRRIADLGSGWNCFTEPGSDGQTVATLLKWCRPEQLCGEELDVS